MIQINTLIFDQLIRVSKEKNINILYATEVGSRAYRYNNKDSDYDIKFIYIYPEKEYLRIDRNIESTISLKINIAGYKLDVVGWEITKFLKLLYDGNYSTFEWLNSPIVYYQDIKFNILLSDKNKYFIPFKAVYSYYKRALDLWNEIRFSSKDEPITTKQYLHIIDCILNAKQCNTNKLPPDLITTHKLSYVKDIDVIKEILKLIDMRRNGIINVTEDIPELGKFIDNSLAHLSAIIPKWDGKRDSSRKLEEVDKIFYQLLK